MDLPITRRGIVSFQRSGDYCCNNSLAEPLGALSAVFIGPLNAQKFPWYTLRGTIEGSLFER